MVDKKYDIVICAPPLKRVIIPQCGNNAYAISLYKYFGKYFVKLFSKEKTEQCILKIFFSVSESDFDRGTIQIALQRTVLPNWLF